MRFAHECAPNSVPGGGGEEERLGIERCLVASFSTGGWGKGEWIPARGPE